ncbi:unnamed protein product [Prorocentrum cordatum]|uniref:Uncharacterized protein n=1 Tax=Prorocentrum cordatum TaxID=2364126 RepID=A0ABN9RY00_9DINO|nr:unnamed protein product [Polarella glacialis]
MSDATALVIRPFDASSGSADVFALMRIDAQGELEDHHVFYGPHWWKGFPSDPAAWPSWPRRVRQTGPPRLPASPPWTSRRSRPALRGSTWTPAGGAGAPRGRCSAGAWPPPERRERRAAPAPGAGACGSTSR